MKLAQAGFRDTAVLQASVGTSDNTDLAATSQTNEHLFYVVSEAWNHAPNQQKLCETHFDFLC